MIAHVAEKGEDRGRVVLELPASGRLSAVAVEAAVRMAQAFRSEIESLFVEDAGLFDVTGYGFTREISHSGRTSRPLTAADLEAELKGAARHMQRIVADLAGRAEVPLRFRIMRDRVDTALAAACAENGPWNVIAIAEPLGLERAESVGRLLEAVHGTTGIVVVGPHARRTTGSVVAIVEEAERVPGLLRTAGRIASATGGEVTLLVVAGGPIEASWLEGQVRLALESEAEQGLAIAVAAETDPRALAARLVGLGTGFAIARFGGLVVPSGPELAALAQRLESPMLLVR